MILVRDVIQLDRTKVNPDKLDEFDWYVNLKITIEEFGYLIHCTCGQTMLGFAVDDAWMKSHFEHRDMSHTSVIECLENYENKDQ